jgi:undecaprenyl-diphosphatase
VKKLSKSDKKILIIAIAGLLLLALAFIFDNQIVQFFTNIKNPVVNTVFAKILFIEQDYIFYPLVILATLLILFFQKKKTIFTYLKSLVIALAFSFILKIIIAKPRPMFASNDSFPSGHSTLLFTTLPFLEKAGEIIWFVFSLLFVIVRIWAGLHYASDIIAGALIGYFLPIFAIKLFKKIMKDKQKTKSIKKAKHKRAQ